jgi:long-subunit acyl-CoA synthetase (AMP-forming)
LGIISKNREEWAISALASMRSSVTVVPFYESLGTDVIAYMLNQTELTTICCENKYYEKVLQMKREGKIEKLKNVIIYGEKTEEECE